MSAKIKAITFDLWDTVFIDDSDEPKRKAAGRLPKPAERRRLVRDFIQRHKLIEQSTVDKVYDTVDLAFRKVWHEQYVTWHVRERLELILAAFDVKLPNDEMNELVRLHEEMELEFMPDIVPGVKESIATLSEKYSLGVISDAIFSPGKALRKILEHYELLHFFNTFIFSDELGHSKPEPAVFVAACQGLNVKPNELVHIGDREHNDILYAKKLGVNAVLCTAALDRGSDPKVADGAFSDYTKLDEIIENLNN